MRDKQIDVKVIIDDTIYSTSNEEDRKYLTEVLRDIGYRKASEDGAECPICHGTGRIGTTDWLTKNISKNQLAKEKAEAVAEYEAQLKRDVAREIFAEILKIKGLELNDWLAISELRKKYESEGVDDV